MSTQARNGREAHPVQRQRENRAVGRRWVKSYIIFSY
jgi:hypothetical protein